MSIKQHKDTTDNATHMLNARFLVCEHKTMHVRTHVDMYTHTHTDTQGTHTHTCMYTYVHTYTFTHLQVLKNAFFDVGEHHGEGGGDPSH